MDWMPEALLGFFAGHGRQILIAGEMAVLGTLFIMLVYRLRKRYEARSQLSGEPANPTMPRSEVEALYLKEAELKESKGEIEAETNPESIKFEEQELCPPELSRRIDALDTTVRRC
jgi:hypothetical protein